MSRNAREIFATIDKMDPDAFVAHLTPDVVFTFGNAPAANGRGEVKDAVSGFFSGIAGLTHHIQDLWDVEADVTVAYILVEYHRRDGGVVTVPNVDILRWDGDEVADWRIVIDVAPVFA